MQPFVEANSILNSVIMPQPSNVKNGIATYLSGSISLHTNRILIHVTKILPHDFTKQANKSNLRVKRQNHQATHICIEEEKTEMINQLSMKRKGK